MAIVAISIARAKKMADSKKAVSPAVMMARNLDLVGRWFLIFRGSWARIQLVILVESCGGEVGNVRRKRMDRRGPIMVASR